jgi:hypothetical protein
MEQNTPDNKKERHVPPITLNEDSTFKDIEDYVEITFKNIEDCDDTTSKNPSTFESSTETGSNYKDQNTFENTEGFDKAIQELTFVTQQLLSYVSQIKEISDSRHNNMAHLELLVSKLEKRLQALEQKMEQVWYAPGMPGMPSYPPFGDHGSSWSTITSNTLGTWDDHSAYFNTI